MNFYKMCVSDLKGCIVDPVVVRKIKTFDPVSQLCT